MHVRRAVALSAVVPLLLAGCSGEAEPTPKMPDPTTSSATPTPTETETAETPEVESAEDFIRRWQDVADAMVLTGDTDEFLGMSEGCSPCETYAEQVADVYDQGGRVEFDGSNVLSVEEEADSPPTFIVEVDARTLRIEVPDEDPRTFPAATQRYRMTLARKRDGYTMRYYAVI